MAFDTFPFLLCFPTLNTMLRDVVLHSTTVFTFLQESSDNGEPKKKKVMFNVVETAATENEEDKPKKKVTRVPRESTREIIDADVECEKWNEQCKQQ